MLCWYVRNIMPFMLRLYLCQFAQVRHALLVRPQQNAVHVTSVSTSVGTRQKCFVGTFLKVHLNSPSFSNNRLST